MMNRRFIIQQFVHSLTASAAILICVNSWAAEATRQLDYFLEIVPNLNSIEGRICGQQIAQVAFTLGSTMKWQVNPSKDQLVDNKNNCLPYTAKLNALKQSRIFKPKTDPKIIFTSLKELLPCPTRQAGQENILNKFVSLKLPAGINASFPGKNIDEKQVLLKSRPCSWSSGVMIGDITKMTLTILGSNVELAMPSSLTSEQQTKLSRWLNRGISALNTAYGNLPLGNFQIMIFPTGINREAVPWGQVMRGGGDSVHLYVDETKPLAELNDDWVLVHELSHLLHPYLHAKDGWLAEGLASYYQNVLRARDGLLSPQAAWRKLDAGFRRGVKQFEPHMTLEKDTRQMMRERKYMRVYWGGAAIALLADVHLRLESKGEKSLDHALEKLSACCLPTKARRWQANELVQKLDEIAETTIFSSLYRRYAVGTEFPALAETYKQLGISRSDSGLKFDRNPQALHKLIMQSPQQ